MCFHASGRYMLSNITIFKTPPVFKQFSYKVYLVKPSKVFFEDTELEEKQSRICQRQQLEDPQICEIKQLYFTTNNQKGQMSVQKFIVS